jgi:AcrR family transcriptional regulator
MGRRPAKRSSRAESAAEAEVSAGMRERIRGAFSARATRSGIRAVVMGDLASELRMSATTLYRHFASKDELVSAMVDAWALELAAIDSLDWDKVTNCATALEVLLTWADAWTAILGTVTPAFFEDLHRDHPTAWKRFLGLIQERKVVAGRHLGPFIRRDLHPETTFAMLDHLVLHASNPRFAEQLGISRREAVRTAVSIWGGGALIQRVKLRAP